MKHVIWAAVVGIVVMSVPSETAAQTGTALTEMMADWLELKRSTVQLADRMPAEKYSAKPPFPVQVKGISIDTAQEHFGKRVLYIAQTNSRFLGILSNTTSPVEVADVEENTTKEAAMKALIESFDYGISVLKEQTDQTMMETLNGASLGPASRLRVFTYLHSHTQQINGQLELYLLFNGESLPTGEK